MFRLSLLLKNNRFGIISWTITLALVASMVGVALKWRESTSVIPALALEPTAAPDENPPEISLPALGVPEALASIEREIQIKTTIPADDPRHEAEEYRVARGDSVFAIADMFKLKPETVYWANYEEFDGSPRTSNRARNL